MSTECSQLPESQISCPANWPRTSANVSSLASRRRLQGGVEVVRAPVERGAVLGAQPDARAGLGQVVQVGVAEHDDPSRDGASVLIAARVCPAWPAAGWRRRPRPSPRRSGTCWSRTSTQVSMTLEKPASLPPIVMLTSVVLALSADTWLLSTSAVVAPEHATEMKVAGEFGRGPLLRIGVLAALAAAAGGDVIPGTDPGAVGVAQRHVIDRGRRAGRPGGGQARGDGGNDDRRSENKPRNVHGSPTMTTKGTGNARHYPFTTRKRADQYRLTEDVRSDSIRGRPQPSRCRSPPRLQHLQQFVHAPHLQVRAARAGRPS